MTLISWTRVNKRNGMDRLRDIIGEQLRGVRCVRVAFGTVMAVLALLQGGSFAVANAQEYRQSDRPVDIFIGDSSATNAVRDMTAEQRWTKLFADADGAQELSVAVGGTGYLVGGANTYDNQLTKALRLMKEQHIDADRVRRVFVVGGGNDFSKATIERGVQFCLVANRLAARVAKEFPHAQRLYIPEMSPATGRMLNAYKRAEPFFPLFFLIASSHGFQYDRNWYQWVTDPDANGYVIADETHLTAKGHNETAHRVVGWVNALDGPKVEGTVPEWDGSADTVMRFDANGGVGVVQSLRGPAGTESTIPATGMTNGARSLESWNTKADGTGTSYLLGSETTLPEASVILYAQWSGPSPSQGNGLLRGLRFAAAGMGALVMAAAASLAVVHRRRASRFVMDDGTAHTLANTWPTHGRHKGGGHAAS